MNLSAWRASSLVCLVGFASCGYHVGGKADLVPKSINSIAIPTFASLTTKYRLVDILPEQISREFRSRTRFRIDPDPSTADAILKGTINNVLIAPAIIDPPTGKPTSIRVVVLLTVQLVQRSTGTVLYARPNWSVHEEYANASDPHQFFDESGPAYERLCRDVSRDLVSSIVENF